MEQSNLVHPQHPRGAEMGGTLRGSCHHQSHSLDCLQTQLRQGRQNSLSLKYECVEDWAPI